MSAITDIFGNLIGELAKAGVTWMSAQRQPQVQGSLALPGLSAPVEVIRDRWGVPHIYAQDVTDLFFANGFVHAQDRLWQMELNRRTAQGRLSEVFGAVALETDRASRTFGFDRLGKADWERARPEVRQAMAAYANGVNAYLERFSGKLPVEFTLLNFSPQPWQPQDSTAFARLMIWQLSHAWYGELVRARVAEAVGEAHAAELEVHYPDENPITLPDGISFNQLAAARRLQDGAGPFLDRGKGSNAWAVSAHKSATGTAWLCNDMHLAMRLPGLWYQMHLVGGDMNVTGVTLPALPMVLVGHNARIAWGMTLAYTDCEDVFVEELDPQTPDRYRFRDEWLQAETVIEEIKVKGQPEPHLEKVRITRHGPIISDMVKSAGGQRDQSLALNSMALQPCAAMSGWFYLNQAGNWDEFVEAMRLIEAPQLNVLYADVEGNIGHWVTGRTPLRAKGDGSLPAPGWTGEYEWVGEVPFEEMPHALNPHQGYIVSANHRIVPDGYPHFLGNVWMAGYRARRLVEVFESKDRLGEEDFRLLQMDITCLPGMQFVQRLHGLQDADPDVQIALERLREWDGRLTPDSVGGMLYEVTRLRLVRNLLEPALGADLTLQVRGEGFHPLLSPAQEFYGHDTTLVLRMLDNPASWWVEQAGGRDALLARSLKQAVEWLRAEFGPDVNDWQWGKIHQVTFAHPLSQQKPLDKVFNRGPYPIGGDTDTPLQTASQPADSKLQIAWAPSMRHLTNMADFSSAVFVCPPGQSGQLSSPHYDDMIQPWLDGDYLPMLWTREQVEQAAESRLILQK